MGIVSKLVGLALLLVGIYFLGQNIIFTTQTAARWWQDIPAAGAVISVVGGVMVLMLGGRGTKEMGWMLLGFGILLAFLSGGLILRPTSLWTLFVAAAAMIGGYRLFTTGSRDN